MLSVDFDLNALSEFVAGLSVSEHSDVFLFTADETLLAHKSQHVPGGAGQRGAGSLPTLADTGDPLVDAYRSHLRPEHVSAADGDAFHTFEFPHDGSEYLASATTFRVGDDLVWVVGAVAPKADFLSDVWRSQTLALAASAGALLAAVLLAAGLAQRVSGPVLSLIGFMRRVGGGDLEAQADLGGSREFRELSAALNRMIADLRDRLRLRHSLNVAMEVQQRLLPQQAAQGPRAGRRRPQHLLRRDRRRLLRLPDPGRGRARQRAGRAGRRDGTRRRRRAGDGRRPARCCATAPTPPAAWRASWAASTACSPPTSKARAS